MKKTLIFLLGTVMCWYGNGQESNSERPERIDNLMQAVGDENAWRTARGFYMLEIAHVSRYKLPLVREFWIDFEQPRIMMVSNNVELNEIRVLNVDRGWTSKNNQVTAWDEQMVNGFRSFWPGIPTRIFHLIASNDPHLTYEIKEDRIIFYIDGEFVVWIATDPKGNPVAYGRSNNHAETHFLGEMLPYGPVRLWKEAFEPGGQWGVLMADYQLLPTLSNVSYSQPKD
ncbi:hypothetical protein [Flagellimonas flava]|uniref:Uncharacterized protein n=1 Tax=Flagellimonas flava TaxID=570519 RepID=A0A1M5Q5Q9_9FLAO|nr:hypothetical protein [Allomuricauda flava]SHH09266.1 hypothetical protein SAMN04488116_3512 [Allomuricauda flava]